MLQLLLALSVAATHMPGRAAAAALESRTVTGPGLVSDALIVGRAACGATAWLITDARQLVEISVAARAVTTYDIHGLRSDDRPWGLACTADGTLWSLASPHAVARLSRDGRVVERIECERPLVALFASRHRLVFQQLPVTIGAPLLMWSATKALSDARVWPGLIGRPGSAKTEPVQANLITCGIGFDGKLPCWFPDQATITLSDTTTIAVHPVPLGGPGVDRTLPVWDVALASPADLWILLTAERSFNGRRTGVRLVRDSRRGLPRRQIELGSPARLILSATETTCVLLGARGELMEVLQR